MNSHWLYTNLNIQHQFKSTHQNKTKLPLKCDKLCENEFFHTTDFK